MKKMIIDSDAGVDDSMAILLAVDAHKRGDLKILAITATAGNTALNNVEIKILRTLDIAGYEDIPVYRGAHEALVKPCDGEDCNDWFNGQDGFNDVEFESVPDNGRVMKEYAWEIMNRLSKENPGEVTIVALGPLTNIATALKTEPLFTERVKEIFIMGGNTDGVGNVKASAEFNFYNDPEAAYVVLRESQCPLFIVPWDTCLQNKLEMNWRKEVLGNVDSLSVHLLNKLEENKLFADADYVIADQLTMIAAINMAAVTDLTEEVATVELRGEQTRGMMVLDRREERIHKKKKKNVNIIHRYDINKVKNLIIKSLI